MAEPEQTPGRTEGGPGDVAPTPADREATRAAAAAARAGGDAKPRRPRKPRAANVAAELKELEEKLSNVLTAPAIPMAMAGDGWAANHVSERAHPLAVQIVNLARENDAFRARLLVLMRTSDQAQIVFAAGAYLIPLLAYYGVLPLPPVVRAQLGVPDRREVAAGAAAAFEQGKPGGPVGPIPFEHGGNSQAGEAPAPGTPGTAPAAGAAADARTAPLD